MKQLSVLFSFILFCLPSFVESQNKWDEILHKDSICLDSVEITNKKLENKINKFYLQNKNDIDSNTYLFVNDLTFSEKDTSSFIIMISLRKNLENDLMGLDESNSCYLRINNTLVFVRFFDNRYRFSLLFKRTNIHKVFFFNARKYEVIGTGFSKTTVGYKVTLNNNEVHKIKRLYYLKYPASRLKRFYYSIRYRNYF
ncbi:MAG: hypothetical protein K9J13_07800 [Saprospiraceae bacterium]|nr:hypothetical protein [Saprospiraceae bacterium]